MDAGQPGLGTAGLAFSTESGGKSELLFVKIDLDRGGIRGAQRNRDFPSELGHARGRLGGAARTQRARQRRPTNPANALTNVILAKISPTNAVSAKKVTSHVIGPPCNSQSHCTELVPRIIGHIRSEPFLAGRPVHYFILKAVMMPVGPQRSRCS